MSNKKRSGEAEKEAEKQEAEKAEKEANPLHRGVETAVKAFEVGAGKAVRRGEGEANSTGPPPERRGLLENLPAELARHRILDTAETLEFVKLSPAEWRKLRAAGKAPRPVMLGTRKQGWRIGDLIDWVASRMQPAA